MNFLDKIFGSISQKEINSLMPLVSKINSLENQYSSLSDSDLRSKTDLFKKRIAEGQNIDDFLDEIFATVREAIKRTLNIRPFDVQLIGGLLLHKGFISEMKTGEGKTVVASFSAYANALSGKGVHVVTVNDYLSKRDGVSMGQVYDFLGLSVSVIIHDQSFLYDNTHKELDETRDSVSNFKIIEQFLRECSRGKAYLADITYGTNNEFGFDYLRDNLERDISKLRQRGFNYAIVDEVDSILIDEARTPLIISSPKTESEALYKRFADIETKMIKDVDYTVDYKFRTIAMTESGIEKVEKILGIENIYTNNGVVFVHHLETAIKAGALFTKDKDYVVKDGEIIIVDEFTGRLQPGRRWSEGIHQAIEAKEGVKIGEETKTFASITFQNYFRMYKKLSGMTGTAMTSKEEFSKVYGLTVVEVPTNRPVVRLDKNDLIFKTEVAKFKAIVSEIKKRNQVGQPVLVGTVSIEKSELLSKFLSASGVKHEILNAKNHFREGEIIAQAGKKGAVTIATNMAGRGVDIKLGGNPNTTESYEEIKRLGGLLVIGTERHDARRIDNQLRGRSGRQGDPGETQFFVSLEDHLMKVFGGDSFKNTMEKLGFPDDLPIEHKVLNKMIEQAQNKVEGFNFDARKHVLEFDNVLNYQRNIFYERRRQILSGQDQEVLDYIKSLKTDFEDLDIGEESLTIYKNNLQIVKNIILQTFDMFWVEHLEDMDYLRSSVNLRAYGQRDPLVEYKKEGLSMFKKMESNIKADVVKVVSSFLNDVKDNKQILSVNGGQNTQITDINKVNAPRDIDFKDVSRNDLCPCGSGKKFKKCHGK